jgi:hypothetical protein
MRHLLFVIAALLPFTAFAQAETPATAPVSPAPLPSKITCQRFQSNCNADTCLQLVNALQKDVARKIFTVRRTEIVTYTIDETGAVEKLRGQQAVYSKDRAMVMNYKNVATDALGKIIFTNKDRKGNANMRVEIDPLSGFYLNFFLHTDGSIKEVPVGEPYLGYFGWCSPGDEVLPPALPVESETPEGESSTAPAAPATPASPATPAIPATPAAPAAPAKP